jgi:hypothetical protein
MTDSNQSGARRHKANPVAMAVGIAACALLVVGIGWLVWSSYAGDRSSRMAQEVTPPTQTQAPAGPANPIGDQANSSAMASSGAAMPSGGTQAYAAPAAGNGLSIEIASVEVTTRPDGGGDAAGK